MSGVISKTQALPDGSMLWCVHHKGSYYDNDARMPGTVPVDVRSYVLAKGVDEAKQKGKITECPTSSEDRKIFFVFFLIAFIIWGIIFLFRYLSNDWEEVRGTFFMVSSIVALFFIHLLPE